MSTAPDTIRFSLTARLTTLEPMHLGSGDEELDTSTDATGSFVASMVADASNNPCIPGSSLKGVLRSRAEACGFIAADLNDVFGHEVPQGISTGGKAGCAEFAWAYVEPHTRRDRVETRTSVDPVTRTVADHLLFSEKVLEPGAKFNLAITLHTSKPAHAEQLAALLLGCTPEHPLHLGAHQRMGWGAAAVDEVKVEVTTAQDLAQWWALPLSATGQASALPTRSLNLALTPLLPQQRSIRFALELQIDGPFAVRDSTKPKKKQGDSDSVPRERNGRPLLPATSLMGALRAQAERIVTTLTGQRPARLTHQGSGPPNDLIAILFGCAGWQGALSAAGDLVGATNTATLDQHMIALCRLTGGGKDGAKFLFKAWYRPLLTGQLQLATDRLGPQRDAALVLLALVLRDLCDGVITVGMAASKGWGWVERSMSLWAELSEALRANNVPGQMDALNRWCPEPTALLAALKVSVDVSLKLGLNRVEEPNFPHLDEQQRPTLLPRTPGDDKGPKFHNPYDFLPWPKPVPTTYPGDRASQLHHAAAIDHGHSHDRYHASRMAGEIEVELTCMTPMFIGAERTEASSQGPVAVTPFEVRSPSGTAIRAIPGTSLRGMLSHILEPMLQSAPRVLDADRLLSTRMVSASQGLDHIGIVQLATYADDPMRPTEVVIRGFKRAREASFDVLRLEDWPAASDYSVPSEVALNLHLLSNRVWEASVKELEGRPGGRPKDPKLHTQRRRTAFDKGRDVDVLPAIDGVDRRAATGGPRNPEANPWATPRLTKGQRVYFRMEQGRVAEVSWSQLWRRTPLVGESDQTRPLDVLGLIQNTAPGLAPLGMAEELRELYAAEWLLGAVEHRPDHRPARSQSAMSFASKLQVGLALPEGALQTCRPIVLKELSSPKPPSPALYLKWKDQQNTRGPNGNDLALKFKDVESLGSKTYLHAKRKNNAVQGLTSTGQLSDAAPAPWQSQKEGAEQTFRQVSVVPVEAGSKFKFKIRFQNLNAYEFALLCAALQPSETFEHRLGMGRPLGLGSVKLRMTSAVLTHYPYRYQNTHFGRYPVKSEDLQQQAKRGMKLLANHEDTRELHQAMVRLGEPERVQAPVHYPQVANSPLENENFQWWMDNASRHGLARNLKVNDAVHSQPPTHRRR
ncbi:MAG: hypothetical protein C4K60_02510 [Ideonella sp. MAG2]|nr:MAG: hypothetical protein C4K60_02510 [Ideonella sp. MAG2]